MSRTNVQNLILPEAQRAEKGEETDTRRGLPDSREVMHPLRVSRPHFATAQERGTCQAVFVKLSEGIGHKWVKFV